jgi:hypothetical protein
MLHVFLISATRHASDTHIIITLTNFGEELSSHQQTLVKRINQETPHYVILVSFIYLFIYLLENV